jgi:hypothetical protein
MNFAKKPVQLVRHMHEVIKGYRKQVARGEHYMVQLKEDGVYAFAIFNGQWELHSRTGNRHSNCGLLEDQFRQGFNPKYVYIMEIVDPALSLEELGGILNTNRVKPVEIEYHLYGRLHDRIERTDFLAGYTAQTAIDRYRALVHDTPASQMPDCRVISAILHADETRIRLVAEALIEKGYEGAVAKRHNADWKAGRKQHDSMKIVRGCDYDLMCVGVEEGIGKRVGMVANALCVWRLYGEPDGELVRLPIDLGKGFTDERRIELWHDQAQIVGHCVEVHALQVGSKGSLRIPKVNSIRIDKTEPDL